MRMAQAAATYDPYSYMAPTYDPYAYMVTPKQTVPTANGKRRRCKVTRYAVVLDPLGHSLNADAGVSVGTIFGIYRADDMQATPSSYVLRAGSELIAAGYALCMPAPRLGPWMVCQNVSGVG